MRQTHAQRLSGVQRWGCTLDLGGQADGMAAAFDIPL
jgi:hypothetical protein